jgi:tetratricopeptide (TPR) repeat protein
MSLELENHLKNGTQLLFDLHDPDRAIEEFSRALSIDPQCLVAFVYRHFAYVELKMWAKALADLNQSLRLCPDDHRLYAYRAQVKVELRDYSGAYDDLTDGMQLDGALELLWQRGYVALKLRRLSQSVEDYSEIILMCPEDACAHNNRGLAYMQMGDLEKALADFDKAIELNSDHPDHHNSRARVYMMTGRTDLAMQDSRTALDACDRMFDPSIGDDIVWNDRAEALVRLGRYQEAIDTSRNVLGIAPDDPEPYRFIAEAYCGMGKDNDALEYFNKSIELDPDPEVVQQRAALLQKMREAGATESAASVPGIND